jgi:hypothetical protein
MRFPRDEEARVDTTCFEAYLADFTPRSHAAAIREINGGYRAG